MEKEWTTTSEELPPHKVLVEVKVKGKEQLFEGFYNDWSHLFTSVNGLYHLYDKDFEKWRLTCQQSKD